MEGLSKVSQGLDEIEDLNLDRLQDQDLGHLIVGLETQRARLAAVEAEVLHAFETCRAFRPDGSRTAASWLTRVIRCPERTSRRRFREARRLQQMPTTRLAFNLGEIGDDHVEVLCRLAGSPRDCVKDAFVDDEDSLVELAKRYSFVDFTVAVTYWMNHVDPDGAARSAKDQYDDRRLHMSKSFDGSWHLDGYFDSLQGEIIHNALDSIYQEFFTQDWAYAKTEVGDNVSVDDLARTPAQRRADALVEMATRSQTAPAEGQRPPVLFSVLIGYETAFQDLCQLASGTVVAPGALVP